MAVLLPVLGAAAGWMAGGTATAAMWGMTAATLLSGAMAEGKDQGGGGVSAPPGPGLNPGPSSARAMPQPGTLLSQSGATPGDIGAGLDETNPAAAKKVSMVEQSRRRGRRSTILTGDGGAAEENEFLGGA